MFRTLTIAVLATLACVPVAHGYGPPSGPYGKPVTLTQATATPDASALLKPGAHVTFSPACQITETSAYTRTGGALGGQHRHGARSAWHGQGGAVTYDSRTGTFRNGTVRSVLVAGWCS